jgi:thiamine pyrophosphokinase
MMKPIIRTHSGVTLAGGGELDAATLALARARAPVLVAADGGVRHFAQAGLVADAVVGDMDSATDAALAGLPPGRVHRIAEQDSTDFDKALSRIASPFVLAVGFGGARLDHTLAAFSTLARHPRRVCLWFGSHDVAFLAPRALTLALPVGSSVSLFPIGPVRGESTGLRWPIDGLRFAPAGRIGTSNEAVAPVVDLRFSSRRMLVILPAQALDAALSALVPHRPAEAAPPAP